MSPSDHNSLKDTLRAAALQPSSVSQTDKDISMYVTEKTSRIAAAVCMLTNQSDSTDPIRHALETTSLRLVQDASASQSIHARRSQLLDTGRSLVGLLATAHLSGRLPKRAVEILEEEIVALATFLDRTRWVEGDHVFMPSVLETPIDASSIRAQSYRGPETTHIGQLGVHQETRRPQEARTAQKDTWRDTQQQTQRVSEHYRERVQDNQKDRRATILGLLQKKDRVTVRDVANVVKDVSDKTLQRELLSLVAQGVLVKEGERRWSTYRLA